MAKKPKPTLLELALPAYKMLHGIFDGRTEYSRAEDVKQIEKLLEAEAILRSAITQRKEKPYKPAPKWISEPPETEA